MNTIKLQINTRDHRYPIFIGSGLITKLSKLLNSSSIKFTKCLLVIDSKVPKTLINKILKSLPKKQTIIHMFNANELNKNQLSVNKILTILLKKNFHRNDCLISVGGGITGDVSGFASSIFKRGIKFINVPTTLLAQVDSSIGGKTGINSIHGKNSIGSFYQPSLVISDINFLKTLPKREIICGYGEILKHSLIANKKFFLFLNKNATKILNLKSPFIEKSIHQSCLIKKRIIEIDEKEKIKKILLEWLKKDELDVIITTGGTGLTGRDITPEALKDIADKEIPGFGELFRELSYKTIGTSAMQSRACAVLANGKYIFALPGSSGGVTDAWDGILKYQLDINHKPCNFVELFPRLKEK